MKLHRQSGAGAALVALLAVAAILPGAARAQDIQDAPETIDRERLTQFASAYIAISQAREDFHGEIARVHDEEGRQRAREAVDQRIEEILEAQEMTQEEYDELILLISLDGELRTTFDQIVAQLQEDPS